MHANAAQIAAAEGVGALLAPDPAPTAVPGVPGAADPTQVLPQGSAGAYDPNAATSVLPHTGGPAGAADPTAVLPNTGAADPTAVLPNTGPQGQQPEQPHPWQTQLRAARDRNEQTQIQYLSPEDDPLRHRPQRQVARPQQQPRQAPQSRPQQPQPRGRQQGYQQGYGYAPEPQQYAPPRRPQRYAPPAPEPQRPAREPRQRSANPMKIPGLGCLKGCLFTIVILVVASWLIYELTPVHTWIGQGRGYWHEVSHWVGRASKWIKDLGGSSGGGN